VAGEPGGGGPRWPGDARGGVGPTRGGPVVAGWRMDGQATSGGGLGQCRVGRKGPGAAGRRGPGAAERRLEVALGDERRRAGAGRAGGSDSGLGQDEKRVWGTVGHVGAGKE
jgi:hypothetical protein